MRLLASSKMIVEATREFRGAVEELEQTGVRPELRRTVSDWYAEHFIPKMRHVLGREPTLADYQSRRQTAQLSRRNGRPLRRHWNGGRDRNGGR